MSDLSKEGSGMIKNKGRKRIEKSKFKMKGKRKNGSFATKIKQLNLCHSLF